MASDERPAGAAHGSPQFVEDGLAGERVYDSFVVRLWREVGNPRLLRVELEHAQSGDVAQVRGVSWDWIGQRIAGFLSETRSPPD